MAASRASSIRALNRVAASTRQARKLHMTGPATFPSPLLTTERSASKISKDADRASKRPSVEEALASAATPAARHFNTSRSLKAVNDTSTIDFAYLPDFDPDMHVAPIMRVPLLPDNSYSANSHAFSLDAEPQEEIMRHEILTVSADSTHIHAPSRMADVTDNNSVDFHGMTERVAAAVGKTAKEVEEQASMAKKVWAGLLDDVFGAKPSKV